MKTSLYVAGAILAVAWLMSPAVEGQLSGDQGTLLVFESPNLFVTSPAGGRLQKVPLAKPIGFVSAILGS